MTTSPSSWLRSGILALVAGLLTFSFASAAEFRVGDTVITAVNDVEFGFRDRVVATLRKGVRFQVTDVRSPWIRGDVVLNGEKKTGWLHQRELKRVVELEGGLPSAENAEAAAAALKRLNVRVELDGQGRVYAIDTADTSLADSALAYCRHFSHVVVMELGGTQVGDAGLERLRDVRSLERLYLDNSEVTDEGLKHLQSLENLEVLVLDKTKITGAGLKRLGKLRSLRTLNLGHCKLKDEDLEHLSSLENLEVLTLHDTPLKGGGLLHLSTLANLRVLNLNDTEVEDEGLTHLEGLPSLRMLYLYRTTVTEEAIEKLDETLYSCAIYH